MKESETNTVVTLEEIIAHPMTKAFLSQVDKYLAEIGFTEHGFTHADIVSHRAKYILEQLDSNPREAELAAIAGYLHDIGNVVSRHHHAQAGGSFAEKILFDIGMPYHEIATIINAIGNHHEEDGQVVSRIAAALILADKSDVRRSRVRDPRTIREDIHDRVNYAVDDVKFTVNKQDKTISLNIKINEKHSTVMDYFEIFLDRMIMSRKAAEYLGCIFHLIINDSKLQ